MNTPPSGLRDENGIFGDANPSVSVEERNEHIPDLPAETFAAEVSTPVTLDDLLLLKRRWGVSVAAIVMRLRQLKIVDEEGAQTLFKRRSARWGQRAPP